MKFVEYTVLEIKEVSAHPPPPPLLHRWCWYQIPSYRKGNGSLGVDMMGNETEFRKHLNDHGNFEYDRETVNIQNKKINFFMVTNVADLLRKSVETFNSEGVILICGDKVTNILCESLYSEA